MALKCAKVMFLEDLRASAYVEMKCLLTNNNFHKSQHLQVIERYINQRIRISIYSLCCVIIVNKCKPTK